MLKVSGSSWDVRFTRSTLRFHKWCQLWGEQPLWFSVSYAGSFRNVGSVSGYLLWVDLFMKKLFLSHLCFCKQPVSHIPVRISTTELITGDACNMCEEVQHVLEQQMFPDPLVSTSWLPWHWEFCFSTLFAQWCPGTPSLASPMEPAILGLYTLKL